MLHFTISALDCECSACFITTSIYSLAGHKDEPASRNR